MWASVDPFAAKYYSISPYVYVADNPLKFIDPDGKKIVDANGNVIYTQSGGWAKNASSGAQRIQSVMIKTTTGREQWNKMVNSDNKINLNISNENTAKGGKVTLGFTEIPNSRNPETGKAEFRSDIVVKVTLFDKTITDNTLSKGQVNSGLTADQALAATAGHEAEHATSSQNIQERLENKDLPADQKHDVEAEPIKIGNQIREESRNELKPLESKKAEVTPN